MALPPLYPPARSRQCHQCRVRTVNSFPGVFPSQSQVSAEENPIYTVKGCELFLTEQEELSPERVGGKEPESPPRMCEGACASPLSATGLEMRVEDSVASERSSEGLPEARGLSVPSEGSS